MSKVFISYVHEDGETIDRLARILERNGVDVWLDREQLTPGIRWKSAIAQAIRSGTFFLSVHSKARASRDASYVNEELTVAIEEIRKRPMNKVWLIPIKLDETTIEERQIGGGETLLDLQYCDLSDWHAGTKRLLATLGVNNPVTTDTASNKFKRSFVAPLSTVEDAVEALNFIAREYGASKVERTVIHGKVRRRAISDLCNLGLLQADYSDRTVRLVNPNADQQFSLSMAVAQNPAFKVAIDLLQEHLDASALDVGAAVSDALERDWSDGSMRRNGHALRKWVFLLYPNLRAPEVGELAFMRTRNLEPKQKKKGRAPYITEELLREVRADIDPPFSAAKIARHLGVVPETIRRWKRQNEDRWSEIFGSK